MRISDWSSDVCSSDLDVLHEAHLLPGIGGFQVLDEQHGLAIEGRGVEIRHVVGDDIHFPAQDHLARHRDVTGVFPGLNGSSFGQCRVACPATSPQYTTSARRKPPYHEV